MTRTILGSFAVVVSVASAQETATLTFEVAAIKPASHPESPFWGIRSPGLSFNVTNYTVKNFLGYAYVLHDSQILGGPSWVDKDKFDVVAKAAGEKPSREQLRLMTQTLLVDRFKLKFHRTTKELSVYVLVVAKNGPKLKERHPGDGPPGVAASFRLGPPSYPARNVSMELFCAALESTVLDRPVLDMTGLTGVFDFDLKWKPDETQFGGQGGKGPWRGDDNDPDIFTAFKNNSV